MAKLWTLLFGAAIALMGCTASGDPETISPNGPVIDPDGAKSSSSKAPKSSADEESVSSSSADSLSSSSADSVLSSEASLELDSTWLNLFKWVKVEASSVSRGGSNVKFSVSPFEIASTEVTQEAYGNVMGTMPKQPRDGDHYPVVNVSWYDAVLFCNAFSKLVGLDTAYVYSKVGASNYLEDLEIDYSANTIRLATETEWEIAEGVKNGSTYYWGTDVASKYAYYGQSKGPDSVAQYLPNGRGLYDMAGNVAEWVNDWFGAYPTTSVSNPVGPSKSGDFRCVRGGGWSDKVTALALGERDKKDPLYTASTLGFRVVRSSGFLLH